MTTGDWGSLRLRQQNCTAQHLRYLLCEDYKDGRLLDYDAQPLDHYELANISSLDISKSHNWFIQGISVGRAEGQQSSKSARITNHCNNIILDHCILQNASAGNILNINFSANIVVQNSIIRNAVKVPGADNIGIAIRGQRHFVENIRVVSNEIYNCTDGIQIVYHDRYDLWGYARSVVIEDNDIYLDSDYYFRVNGQEFSCGENGIDVKIGSDIPTKEVKIIGNRIWGMRKTFPDCGGSGSWGDGILLHRKAENVQVSNNVIWNVPNGICAAPSESPNISDVKVVNNRIDRNILFNIARTTQLEQVARGIRVASAIVTDNLIINAEDPIRDTRKYPSIMGGNIIAEYSKVVPKEIKKTDRGVREGKYDGHSRFSFIVKRLSAPTLITIDNLKFSGS